MLEKLYLWVLTNQILVTLREKLLVLCSLLFNKTVVFDCKALFSVKTVLEILSIPVHLLYPITLFHQSYRNHILHDSTRFSNVAEAEIASRLENC